MFKTSQPLAASSLYHQLWPLHPHKSDALKPSSNLSQEMPWPGSCPCQSSLHNLPGTRTHVVLAGEKPLLVAQQLDVPDEGVPHGCCSSAPCSCLPSALAPRSLAVKTPGKAEAALQSRCNCLPAVVCIEPGASRWESPAEPPRWRRAEGKQGGGRATSPHGPVSPPPAKCPLHGHPARHRRCRALAAAAMGRTSTSAMGAGAFPCCPAELKVPRGAPRAQGQQHRPPGHPLGKHRTVWPWAVVQGVLPLPRHRLSATCSFPKKLPAKGS